MRILNSHLFFILEMRNSVAIVVNSRQFHNSGIFSRVGRLLKRQKHKYCMYVDGAEGRI